MVGTCVDSVLHKLSEIQAFHHELDAMIDSNAEYQMHRFWSKACLGYLPLLFGSRGEDYEIDKYWEKAYRQVNSYTRELMFLKMIFWCFATGDDTDPNLRSVLTTIETIWHDLEERIDDIVLSKPEPGEQDWDFLALLLEGTIQQCKSSSVEYCHVFLDSSFKCKALPSDQTLLFLQIVLQNLEVFVGDINIIPKVKVRLILFQSFFQLITANEGISCEELRAFKLCLESFAHDAALLIFLFWAKSANEKITIEAEIDQLLTDTRVKILQPCGSDVMPLYLGCLKAIKLQSSDHSLLHGEVVAGFVDLHLDNLMAALKEDWQIVREGLIFLLTFITNPPQGCGDGEQLALICHQIDLLFDKCVYLISFPPDIMKEQFTLDSMRLSDFAEKLEETVGRIKQLYVKIPDPLSFKFPRTNGLGFYDLLLQNLERLTEKLDNDATFIPFAKNFIIKFEEQLVSLRPFVNSIFELQKGQKEFEGIWSLVINLAYLVEHVINSCSVCIYPTWYHMACLSGILDQIDDMKRKFEKMALKRNLERVENCNIPHNKVLTGSIEPSSTPSERNWLSLPTEQEIIGFKDETRKIIDELMGGYESLGIISIVGMGGLGKSTLAKEIYNSNPVSYHFHKQGFASISQVLDRRNFFMDVLCAIKCKKQELNFMTEDDLAHHLWRCLSGQTYLIVIDDIWDIKAWDAIRCSFPDDKNRSRVIFTTRVLKVALDAKSSVHYLQPRSDDVSSKLLHMKVFGQEDCPASFSKFGNMIVKTCKGLPLAIVVVAGLLARNKASSSWWKEIAEATSQFVGEECKDLIGYSYMHLPEHLKSCFLYMGIYLEDILIRAKELRQLWIGEGFINKSMSKSLRVMGKEYLSELVDRNLVIAVERTCGGEVRTCRLHDIIGDFCRKLAEEDNFLCPKNWYGTSYFSNSTKHNLYRISFGRSFAHVDENVHSLYSWGFSNFEVEKLKLVQVLHLRCEFVSRVPDCLVHLRYMSLGSFFGKISESIFNLWNLDTFIIKGSGIELPKTIWKMKRLRHLEFGAGCKFVLDDDDDEGCHQLLDNIQFLSRLWLFDDKSARAVLRRLPNIQKLSCTLYGSKWMSEDFTIDFLSKLESLDLRSGDGVDFIHGIKFPSTLKRVDISTRFMLSHYKLPPVGELPCLEVLKLHGGWKRWEVEDGQFQKLKYLKIGLYYLEQWNVSFDSFSCLEQLEFSKCSHLQEIPSCFAELPTLQRIQLEGCNKELESAAVQIQKEQTDNGNELRLEFKKRQKGWQYSRA